MGKMKRHSVRSAFLEVPPRFELGVELLQSSALPLGYGTRYKIVYAWSPKEMLRTWKGP